jgi:hypothetical protein
MMPLLAAAVAARLAHPSASHESPATAPAITASPDGDGQDDEPDALLRQLRELADLHSKGVLTDDEFAPWPAGVETPFKSTLASIVSVA